MSKGPSDSNSTNLQNPELLSKLGDSAESLYTAIFELFQGHEIQLPVLPSNVANLIACCAEPVPDMDLIAHSVTLDVGLSSQILRRVNSASFSPVSEIGSIHAAVRRLGTRVIADLAVSESLRQCLNPRTRDLLQLSAVSGVYSFQVGRLSGSASKASLLPGLMHDIGRPIATTLLCDLQQLPEWGLTDEAVRLLADEMHVPVGLRLVREWKLPSTVDTAIRFHKDPSEAPEGSRAAHIANLADLFAAWTFNPEELEGAIHTGLPIVRDLGLDEQDLADLFDTSEDARAAAKAFT